MLHSLSGSKFVTLGLGLDGGIDAEVKELLPAGLMLRQVLLQALDVLRVHRIVAGINVGDEGMVKLRVGSTEDGNSTSDAAPHGGHSMFQIYVRGEDVDASRREWFTELIRNTLVSSMSSIIQRGPPFT